MYKLEIATFKSQRKPYKIKNTETRVGAIAENTTSKIKNENEKTPIDASKTR